MIKSLKLVVEDFFAVCYFLLCQNPTFLELLDFLIVVPMVRVGPVKRWPTPISRATRPLVNAGCFSQPNEKSNSLALALQTVCLWRSSGSADHFRRRSHFDKACRGC
jgi:hypothetical protein